jgi:GMP synthase (glutamine-hydrolysing)
MIVVLDFGSQYNQNIARRIREQNVYSEILPSHADMERLRNMDNLEGIILSGGPNSVYEEGAPQLRREILHLDVPVLGICYGMQAMAHTLDGVVEHEGKREYGKTNIGTLKSSELFKGIDKQRINVWMSHGDVVRKLPAGFETIARTENGHVAAVMNRFAGWYGVQFHPEVDNTEHGREILSNFVDICKCKRNWTMKNYIDERMEEAKIIVGDKPIVCGVSGGVDSTVTAVMLHRIFGEQLTCITVDNGVLRKNEIEYVKGVFEKLGIEMHVAHAAFRFLDKLEGITGPEEKRKIIGNEFIYVFADKARGLGLDLKSTFLGQGTLYTDRIESGPTFGGTTATIKSHHNVGGLPDMIEFTGIYEPLRFVFKD